MINKKYSKGELSSLYFKIFKLSFFFFVSFLLLFFIFDATIIYFFPINFVTSTFSFLLSFSHPVGSFIYLLLLLFLSDFPTENSGY